MARDNARLRGRIRDAAASVASVAAAPVGRVVAGRRENSPRSLAVWRRFGVEPVRHHYYEPLVWAGDLPDEHWREEHYGAALDLAAAAQLDLLREMEAWRAELSELARFERGGSRFSYDNRFFAAGDADALYCMLRLLRPRRLIEVGAGVSTLVATAALTRNAAAGHSCEHTCVEPFEAPWLERLDGPRVLRTRVEDVPEDVFAGLGDGDVLFIDSSHTVRPGGDVLHLLFAVVPRLAAGVSVHFHDIFLPGEYPREWVVDRGRRWHEQYLLAAFLAYNEEFEVRLALNWLLRTHPDELRRAFPALAGYPERAPGSFWIRRRRGRGV
jgi:hypothetical protein